VPADSSHPSHDAAASPTRAARSGNSPTSLRDQIEGLKIIEQRLLTFFDYLAPSDSEGRRNLEARIAKIRRARDEAIAELRVSPHALGAVLRLNELFHPNLHETAAPRTHGSRDFEQEQTEATQRNDACDASTV